MAGTGTVAQFADSVSDIWILMFLVWIRLKITGMTSGTIRLIRRERPDYNLGIRLVASGAERICGVIEGFERQRHVHEVVRNPGEGVMTSSAFAGCDEVARILAHCGRTVMAG